jgi:CubicO group peptidase (beta-lactamase class C family)
MRERFPAVVALLVGLFLPVNAQSSGQEARLEALSAPTDHAQSEATPKKPKSIAEAKALSGNFLRGFMNNKRIPGLSVAVAHEGKVVWSQGFGWADLENKVPVTPLTKFRIGSVSKPFTAALVARLREQGKIDIDVPIQNYVPDFPEKQEPITIRHLLSHTSGIRHYAGKEFFANGFATIEEGLAIFKDAPLEDDPGQRFIYTSYGYNLIGVAVEAACGSSFEDCLARYVLGPLGLRHTVVDHAERLIRFRARGYVLTKEGELVNAPPHPTLYKLPAGGLLSIPEELVTFGSAHLRPGLLSAETLEQLFADQQTTDGESIGFGLGWVLTGDSSGRRVWGHLGGSVGGCSALLVYPESGLVVAVTANRDVDWSEKPAATIASHFLAVIDGN